MQLAISYRYGTRTHGEKAGVGVGARLAIDYDLDHHGGVSRRGGRIVTVWGCHEKPLMCSQDLGKPSQISFTLGHIFCRERQLNPARATHLIQHEGVQAMGFLLKIGVLSDCENTP